MNPDKVPAWMAPAVVLAVVADTLPAQILGCTATAALLVVVEIQPLGCARARAWPKHTKAIEEWQARSHRVRVRKVDTPSQPVPEGPCQVIRILEGRVACKAACAGAGVGAFGEAFLASGHPLASQAFRAFQASQASVASLLAFPASLACLASLASFPASSQAPFQASRQAPEAAFLALLAGRDYIQLPGQNVAESHQVL